MKLDHQKALLLKLMFLSHPYVQQKQNKITLVMCMCGILQVASPGIQIRKKRYLTAHLKIHEPDTDHAGSLGLVQSPD